jgi:hypothetical protein
MTTEWNLPTLLASMHDKLEQELRHARQLGHPTEKGDASESVWIDVFNTYLPNRYHAVKATVVDSNGAFSEQIDVVIHDRQYTPLVFTLKESLVVPAESVYAVFEAKQDMTAAHLEYAQKKAASVRNLYRSTVPVPTLDGVRPAKPPGHILAGILTLNCPWTPPFGDSMMGHLQKDLGNGLLDLGCVADSGWFERNKADQSFVLHPGSRASIQFLFELIAKLQELATVPMLDIRAYAKHIP